MRTWAWGVGQDRQPDEMIEDEVEIKYSSGVAERVLGARGASTRGERGQRVPNGGTGGQEITSGQVAGFAGTVTRSGGVAGGVTSGGRRGNQLLFWL